MGELHSLVALAECKRILGLDDREDGLAAFCLASSTFAIEARCRRSLLVKTHSECLDFYGCPALALREYPVREVLSVEAGGKEGWQEETEFLLWPQAGLLEETPYFLQCPPGKRWGKVKVRYTAGYEVAEVPGDIQAACVEMAAWFFARHRGGLLGALPNYKAAGLAYEAAMPESVKSLLESYRRILV